MNEERRFVVVEFEDEKIEILLKKWICSQKQSWFASYTSARYLKALNNNEDPDYSSCSWNKFNVVKIIGYFCK